MLAKLVSALALGLLDWAVKRLEKPDTAVTAGRNDAVRDRIRERVREYEDRIRRAGRSGEGGA